MEITGYERVIGVLFRVGIRGRLCRSYNVTSRSI